jgi:hypothetical protein
MEIEGKVWLNSEEHRAVFAEVDAGAGDCVRLELWWRDHGLLSSLVFELDPPSAAWLAAGLSAQVAARLRGE